MTTFTFGRTCWLRCCVRFLTALSLFVGIGETASANTRYSVNLNIGASGTATGEILTDGTIGTIGAANILDWNLTVNDGVSGAVTLLGPSSGNNSFVALNGSAVSATATALLFNFSSPSAAGACLYFETTGLPVSFLWFGGDGAGGYSGNCAGGQAGNVEAIEDQSNSIQSTCSAARRRSPPLRFPPLYHCSSASWAPWDSWAGARSEKRRVLLSNVVVK